MALAGWAPVACRVADRAGWIMADIRVHHLNCAHIRRIALGGLPLACHVLLVETPASGLVLVDTGLGTADYAAISSRLGRAFAYGYARPSINPELAAIRQVAALGFDPRDVRHIVQTHLDLDHVGGLSDFPWAAVHVHEAELAAAMARKGARARGRYHPPMWAHGPQWQTYSEHGEPWCGFGAVRVLAGLPEQIIAIPLFGHTRGHCGIAVQTAQGWLLDAGDAFYDAREVHGPRRTCSARVRLFEAIVTTNRPQRIANQDRLRRLTAERPDIEVFSAHDPTAAALRSPATAAHAGSQPEPTRPAQPRRARP
jgi:glyoxylase-like metal-dependent hydrolase (beta-lactamase superfamily II)